MPQQFRTGQEQQQINDTQAWLANFLSAIGQTQPNTQYVKNPISGIDDAQAQALEKVRGKLDDAHAQEFHVQYGPEALSQLLSLHQQGKDIAQNFANSINNMPAPGSMSSSTNTPNYTDAQVQDTPSNPTSANQSYAGQGASTQRMPSNQNNIAQYYPQQGLIGKLLSYVGLGTMSPQDAYYNSQTALNNQRLAGKEPMQVGELQRAQLPLTQEQEANVTGGYNTARITKFNDFLKGINDNEKNIIDQMTAYKNNTPMPTKLAEWTKYNKDLENFKAQLQDLNIRRGEVFDAFSKMQLINPRNVNQQNQKDTSKNNNGFKILNVREK